MNLPIYELKINDSLQDESEVSYVALVDAPAIQREFQVFSDQFIEPSKGEHQDEFLQRCIKYVIDEGKEPDQAVAICNSLWDNHFDGGVSFDYDGVLTKGAGIDLLDKAISRGTNVYIVSARSDDAALKEFAAKHKVKAENVFATGSNKAKVEKIKELGVSKHYDDNPDVISAIGSIGSQFAEDSQKMTSQKMTNHFQIISEDEHIISGPLMVADMLIYRNNEQFGEHYVKFTAETIKAIAIKFSKKKYSTNVNLMHDPNKKVDGVTMFESFIVDKKRGVMPMSGYADLPDGSWFGSFYVENPKVWDMIKSGEFKGFSVEGMFDYEANMTKEEKMLNEIAELINSNSSEALDKISAILSDIK